MGDRSNIEWTDATWNPVHGCSKVSPGCAHCYAETISHRFGHTVKPWTPEHAAENVTLHPERLDQPLRWKRPRRVFVNSMSDLFHEQVPDEFIAVVFAVMQLAPEHTFQVLTKRPGRMRSLLTSRKFVMDMDDARMDLRPGSPDFEWPLPNVWLGVSVENNRHATRADALRDTPAAVRFISAEPLLGPLDRLDLTGLDWVIVGGESGHGARPMKLVWAADIVERCLELGVAVFVKQLGTAAARDLGLPGKGGDPDRWPTYVRDGLAVREMPFLPAPLGPVPA